MASVQRKDFLLDILQNWNTRKNMSKIFVKS